MTFQAYLCIHLSKNLYTEPEKSLERPILLLNPQAVFTCSQCLNSRMSQKALHCNAYSFRCNKQIILGANEDKPYPPVSANNKADGRHSMRKQEGN